MDTTVSDSGATTTVTLDFDSIEIGSTTWGSGSQITSTFTQTGALDVTSTIQAGSGNITLTDATGNILHDALVACADTQILKWATGTDWGCAADADTDTTDLDIGADTGSNVTLAAGDLLDIVGGVGMDTTVSDSGATTTVTLDFDSIEIGSTTWGSGSQITWTFDAGTTDPTLVFGDNTIAATAATFTVTGALDVTSTIQAGSGNITLTDATGNILHDALVACADTEILKYATATAWGCAADADSAGTWTDGGTYIYPTAGEVLGNSASDGANKIAGIYVADDTGIILGTTNDFTLNYDETTDDRLELSATAKNFAIALTTGQVIISGSAEGTAAQTITAGDLTITDGDLNISGGEISATTDDTSTTGFSFVANTITSGNGLTLSATGLTTGKALDITATSAPTDGTINEAIDINITHTPTSAADNFQSINLTTTDATTLGNTVYNLYSTLTPSGNLADGAAPNYYGLYGNVAKTGTDSANTSNATTLSIGVAGIATNTASTASGDANNIRNTYGGYFTATGSTAGSDVTAAYGIYATAASADTNYAGYFSGDIRVTGHEALGAQASVDSNIILNVNENKTLDDATIDPPFYGIYTGGTYTATDPGAGNPLYISYGAYIAPVFDYSDDSGGSAFVDDDATGLFVSSTLTGSCGIVNYGCFDEVYVIDALLDSNLVLGSQVDASSVIRATADLAATFGATNVNILHARAVNTNGNVRGLFLDGANLDYGLYQDSTTPKNILAVNTRIGGTTDPTVALDVTGAGSFTGALDVTSTIQAGSGNITLTDATGNILHDALVACADTEILKWATATAWGCAADADTDTTDLDIGADTGSNVTLAAGDLLDIVGGVGMDTTVSDSGATTTVTLDFDSIEIGSTTWGS